MVGPWAEHIRVPAALWWGGTSPAPCGRLHHVRVHLTRTATQKGPPITMSWNLAAILEFGRHLGVWPPSRNLAVILEFGHHLGIWTPFYLICLLLAYWQPFFSQPTYFLMAAISCVSWHFFDTKVQYPNCFCSWSVSLILKSWTIWRSLFSAAGPGAAVSLLFVPDWYRHVAPLQQLTLPQLQQVQLVTHLVNICR